MFLEFLARYKDNIAAVDDQLKEYSYKDLWINSQVLISHLKGRPGLVFNFCENTIDGLTGYLAFLINAETKQLLLSPRLDRQLLLNLVSTYKPTFIYISNSENLNIDSYELICEFGTYKLFAAMESYHHSFNPNLAILMSTSGSTGSPKLVRITYENLLSNARSIGEYLNLSDIDRSITTLPMNYAFGLSIINSHLVSGGSVVLNNFGLSEKSFWSLLDLSKASSFGGVPFTFEMLKRLKFEKMNLPHLKCLLQAGGKLNSETAKFFAEICSAKGLRFFIMYGQTEATARMSYLPWEKCLEKPESIGIAIPDGRFTIKDDLGNIIEGDNIIGELIYHGKNVTMGYAMSPSDFSLSDENKGELATGDLAKRDADGFYEIVGRKTRMIKICGSRYSLDQIEDCLSKNGINVACSGEDDMLVIFLTDLLGIDRTREIVTKTLGILNRYFKIKIISNFPRNDFGKINHALLRVIARENDV